MQITKFPLEQDCEEPERDASPLRRVLVADDSRLQRRILSSSLRRWGFEVIEAASGEEAVALSHGYPPDLVISDWIMPGINGLETVRQIRNMSKGGYIYMILLTTKSESDEVVAGLEAGADDFLSKPVNTVELRARLTAGERVLRMERDLSAQNKLVRQTLAQMQRVYGTLDRDLIEARKLQMSLVPERSALYDHGQLSFLFHPSRHIGGDLVGKIPISETRLGLYALDVSGHGIASALITARLAGWLSSGNPEQNVALTTVNGETRMLPPDEICRRLNSIFIAEIDTEHYFTLVVADIDLATGRIRIAQAGHPHPLIQKESGEVRFIGQGGMPIGLIDEAEYSSFEIQLEHGDKFFIYSDGLTECHSEETSPLGETGLAAIFRRHSRKHGQQLIEAITEDLLAWRRGATFEDDISGVLIEYCGG